MRKYRVVNGNSEYVLNARDSIDAVQQVRDLALYRVDAMDRCIGLGKQFIKHFDKVYTMPRDSAVSHWIGEMSGWYKSVRELRLKPDSKPILDGTLRDWFFTAGAEPQMFMKSPTSEEILAYDRFVTDLFSSGNVRTSIAKVISIK